MHKHGQNASKDCGNLLLEGAILVDILEVAHSIPRYYVNYKPSSGWSTPVLLVDIIWFLFRPLFVPLIDGIDIDLPQNAITRTTTLHSLFVATLEEEEEEVYDFSEYIEDIFDIACPSTELEAQNGASKSGKQNAESNVAEKANVLVVGN
ncbi:hypothetical protein F5B21DRAFT_509274 [Xylaria acuta]|nr:hypothetical protein F5B21DRAFT_509274 [Xylaria acuta]